MRETLGLAVFLTCGLVLAAVPSAAIAQAGTGYLAYLCRKEPYPEGGTPLAITLADAVEQCTQAIEKDDLYENEIAKAYNNRCWLRTEIGDASERAIRDCSTAVSLNPRLASAYVNRGRLWVRLGNVDEARKDFDKAIELDLSLAAAWNNRGELALREKKYQPAMNAFDHAIDLEPTLAAAYNNRGAVFEAVGAYDKAIAEFDKALDIDPTFADAILNRGIIALRRGAYKEAVDEFTRSTKHREFFGRAFLLRGFAHEAMGRPTLARVDYRRAYAAGITSDWLAERIGD